MKKHVLIKDSFKILMFAFLMFFGTNNIQTAYAASLQYFDGSAGNFITYTGNTVKYTYNDFDVDLTQPGILIGGTALADYNELFVNELGISAQRAGNDILFSDANTTILVSVNSNTAWVNGMKQTMNAAPVMVYTGEDVRYYVPTRFIAETFGYEYVWVSSSSTVHISKYISYTIDNKVVNNSEFYKISYNNNILLGDMPVLSYNGVVIIPLKQVLQAVGCSYYEDNQNIFIEKSSLKLVLDKFSKTAYLNNKKIIAEDVPLQVKDNITGMQYTYTSLEFITDLLGFHTLYDGSTRTIMLSDGITGIYSTDLYTTGSQPKKDVYFEWFPENILDSAGNTLTKIIAYPEENYDVVDLYGVSVADMVSFFDNGMIIVEIKKCKNALGTRFYSDYETSHLNYSLLTDVNESTRLFFIAGPDDQWKIIDGDSCVKVIFYKDLFELTENRTQVTNYPDDKLIIPIEDNIVITDISDNDNYLEQNFEICINGNHLNFYNDNMLINPYYGVEKCEIRYDSLLDITFVKIFTKSICAYSYTLENGYLAITIGRPKEFFSKIIVLDAGHGGIDPGASKNSTKEKDLNFKILNTYTKDLFASSDVKVYFTRETDVKIDLYERAAFAVKVNADMFISLHMNANNSTSVKGTEVFYSSDNNNTSVSGFNSALLAKTLANNISTAINTKNRGATKSEFVVVKYNTVPAVLIELGYMTNASELEKLKNSEYQQKTAKAIYSTVITLFNDYLFR